MRAREDPPAPGREPPRREVFELSSAEFSSACEALLDRLGEPPYRAAQIRDWLYRRTPERFEDMTDLPRGLRRELEARWVLHPLEEAGAELSADGTRKFLWLRSGAGSVESVAIPDRGRVTFCVSTQEGCPVRCSFCATGRGGYRGQLRASEIVDQVLQMRRIVSEPTNIVYMGMGEPLLNYRAVRTSLEVLTSPGAVGFGARRITVSTVGVPERIRDLARDFPQVKLAVSLHAPADEIRSRIVPLNDKHPLSEVLDAVRFHVRTSGKQATFEYVILPGVNDGEGEAKALARLLRGIPSRINLIGFNPFPGAPYEKPTVRRVLKFRDWLNREFPGAVTVRRSRGEDIRGACGQLSAHARKQSEPRGERGPGAGGGKERGLLREGLVEGGNWG
ncbi:MAG: 23S rRNA (adenine(2503)-C(2))-methyltransferase RlmN [Planctomycetota bacterium]